MLSSCSNFPSADDRAQVSEMLPDKLHYVLMKKQGVFAKSKSDLGCTNLVEHRIDLEPDAVPWHEGARRLAPFKAEKVKEEIKHLLSLDLIEPAYSPWACGIVVAKKKGNQLRFCCDFRHLNAATLKDAYPIPRIDESLAKLGQAKLFKTLDLGSAFRQVPLRKEDLYKTAFASQLGLHR